MTILYFRKFLDNQKLLEGRMMRSLRIQSDVHEDMHSCMHDKLFQYLQDFCNKYSSRIDILINVQEALNCSQDHKA